MRRTWSFPRLRHRVPHISPSRTLILPQPKLSLAHRAAARCRDTTASASQTAPSTACLPHARVYLLLSVSRRPPRREPARYQCRSKSAPAFLPNLPERTRLSPRLKLQHILT